MSTNHIDNKNIAEESTEMKIVFAPGSFDNFDGSQEELDELIAEITRMVKSGELQETARELDPDDPEDAELIEQMFAVTDSAQERTLQ
jgi:hypothetical protein